MSQGSTIVPTSGIVSGPEMGADINTALDALRTCFSGAAAPDADPPEAGQYWLDTSTALPALRQYSGTEWIALWILDSANNIVQGPTGPIKTTGGSGSAYTLDTTPYLPIALNNGQKTSMIVHTANLSPCTLNHNALGNIPLRSAPSVEIPAGTIVSGSIIETTYISSSNEYILSGFFAGSNPVPPGVSMEFSGFVAPAGYLMENGQAVSRISFATLLNVITLTQTGIFSAGSKIVTGLADTTYMKPGHPVESPTLAPGTVITAILSATSLTVSNNAAGNITTTMQVFPWGNGDGTNTFNVPFHRGRMAIGSDTMGLSAANVSQITTTINTTSGNATVTVGSINGLSIGMYINSLNVPFGTTLISVSPTVVMSAPASGTASGTAVRFSALTDANGVGGYGGAPSYTMALVQVPAHGHNVAGSVSGFTGGATNDHTHNAVTAYMQGSINYGGGSGRFDPANQTITTAGANQDHQHFFSGSFSVTSGNAGSSQAMIPTLPVIVKNFVIKT